MLILLQYTVLLMQDNTTRSNMEYSTSIGLPEKLGKGDVCPPWWTIERNRFVGTVVVVLFWAINKATTTQSRHPAFINVSLRRTVSCVQQYAYRPLERLSTNVPSCVAGRRTFSQSAARRSYADTIQNLLIHKDTKVLCQGFTGKMVIHYPSMVDEETED